MDLASFARRIVAGLTWLPRRIYRQIVIEEQARARRADERRASLLELRDVLGRSAVIEHVHLGSDPRLRDIEVATTRARVLVADAPEAHREAVVAYCDAFDEYRRKWSGATTADLERRQETFRTALDRLGETLRAED
jgi:phage-related baseplate assembly protein